MPSYTPKEQAETTVWDAMYAGFASMGLAAIPTSAGVYAAMQFSPKFVKVSMVLKATICLVYKILSLSSLNQHPTLQITP
jgi:hypothetical protein